MKVQPNLDNYKSINVSEAKQRFSKNILHLAKIQELEVAIENCYSDIEFYKDDAEYVKMVEEDVELYENQIKDLHTKINGEDLGVMDEFRFIFQDGEGGSDLINFAPWPQ